MKRPGRNPRKTVRSSRADAKPPAAPPLAGWRKWVFRLLALTLAPVLILGGLEGGLRLAGYGYSARFFKTIIRHDQPTVIENDKFSWRFFPPSLARHPLPIAFSPEKPDGVYRVFVLGESAAMGDPEPAFGFSRILEVLLKERFPKGHFEVINLAITAINSHVILPIARECAHQHADLWVIYMGHNEVPGPFGPGTIFGAGMSRLGLIRASIALKATRIGQLLDDLRQRFGSGKNEQPSWRGLEMFLDQEFAQDDPRLRPMYANFRQNLLDILRAGQRAGVGMVLCTPASNLKDSAPFASLHDPHLSEAQKQAWDKSYQAGEAALRSRALTNALPLFEQAAGIDSHFADLPYQTGLGLLAEGHPDQARPQFEAARDLDTLRFRTDSRLNHIIEETAQAWRDRGVSFCDTRQDLAQSVPGGIPGEESFYDHVHLTFAGNYALARAIADQVSPKLPASLRSQDTGAWAGAELCGKRLAYTDWNQLQLLESMRHRLLQAPFTNQLNHLARQRSYLQQIEALRSAVQPEHLQAAAQLCRDALARNPDDPSLHENYARILAAKGENQASIDEFQHVIDALPQEASGYNNIGLLLQRLGRNDQAETFFRQALRLRPGLAEAHNGIGLLQVGRGDLNGAIVSYRQALKSNPDLVEAQVNLGQALERQDKLQEAEQILRRALRSHPNYPPAELALGDVLLKTGQALDAVPLLSAAARSQPEVALKRERRRVEQQPSALEYFKLANVQGALKQSDQALQSLQRAIDLNTNFWEARYLLGVELATRGRLPEAQEQFQSVIQMHPGFALAHLNLGVALAKQRQWDAATVQFQEVLHLEGTNEVARQYLARIDALKSPVPGPER